METHAYPERLLPGAMTRLGDALDYAARDCSIPPADFLPSFLATPLCPAFERGDPRVVAGLSGVEIARAAIERGEATDARPPRPSFSRGPEHWCGWALAYAQWRTDRRFSEILAAVPPLEILRLYPALHEADPDRFADLVSERLRTAAPGTRLAQLRSASGLTQRALADKAGIGLRSVQMYEQRRKDVNRAEAITVLALSRALGCRVEDLLEPLGS